MEDRKDHIEGSREAHSIEWLLLEEELASSGTPLTGGAPMAGTETPDREAPPAEDPADGADGADGLDEADEADQPDKEKDEAVSPLLDWIGALVTSVVAVVLLFTFVVQLISVEGGSMQPTLLGGDRLVVVGRLFTSFDAGDVVIVQDYNARLSDRIVKRIVATGGQTVDIDFEEGIVYVDGEALVEPYINEPTYTPEGVLFPLTLGENEVFLMGDNRNHSSDSRHIDLGPVDQRYIVGKAVFLLSPGADPETKETDWGRIGPIH